MLYNSISSSRSREQNTTKKCLNIYLGIMLLDVNLDLMIINEVEMVKSLITYIIYRLINMFGATMFGSLFFTVSRKTMFKIKSGTNLLGNLCENFTFTNIHPHTQTHKSTHTWTSNLYQIPTSVSHLIAQQMNAHFRIFFVTFSQLNNRWF